MQAKEFFYTFGKALYRLDSLYDEFAKKSKVSPTLLWILYALNDGKAHTQREICLDWELPKSTVNTGITELKKAGYVTLTPIKGKRREMTVLLTESGKAYAERMLSTIYQKEARTFASLTGEEKQVVAVLEKMEALLKEEKV